MSGAQEGIIVGGIVGMFLGGVFTYGVIASNNQLVSNSDNYLISSESEFYCKQGNNSARALIEFDTGEIYPGSIAATIVSHKNVPVVKDISAHFRNTNTQMSHTYSVGTDFTNEVIPALREFCNTGIAPSLK